MKFSQLKPRNRLVLALDSQALQAFQSCERKYYLGHVEHLVKIRSDRRQDGEKIAVNSGQLVHDMMNRVNRIRIAAARGRFPKFTSTVTISTIVSAGLRVLTRDKSLTDDERIFYQTKLVEFLAWDKLEGRHYKPLGTEVGFSKIIYEDQDVIFLYEGRIDLVLRAELDPVHFNTWLDYKSSGRDIAIYKFRNQFLGYSWTMESNMGFVLSFGMQKEKKDPFKYQPIYHSDSQISQWRSDAIECYRYIVSRVPFGSSAFQRRRASCDNGTYGWCPYTTLCDNASAPLVVQAGLRKTFYQKRVWTPWT